MPRAIMVNSDAQYYKEVEKKKVVKIIQRESITINKKEIVATEGGIYSKELGSIVDIDADIRDCSCECQNYKGNFYEGLTCPICNTKVEKVFLPDLEKMGWIDLDEHYIINPEAYAMISTIIPKSKLQKILSIDYSKSLTVEGNIIKDRKITKATQYDNIGIMQFRKHFDDIIRYFASKKKKEEEAEFLIKMKNRAFSSKIMVYSSYLRPLLISSSKKQTDYDPINKCYSVIATNADILKRNKNRVSEISNPSILYNIQETLNELYELVIRTKISGKNKITRSQIGGGRMSWSSRLVIVPNLDMNQDMDSVKMSYKAFLELYSFEIINILIHGYYPSPKFAQMTPFEVIGYVNRAKYANVVYEDLYSVIQILINTHQDGLWCLIERAPILNIGSAQMLKVTEVIKDATANSLYIPITSIESQNGDWIKTSRSPISKSRELLETP